MPVGTRMVWYQPNAPTGWTQYTGLMDRVLRVTTSSDGGSYGGNWTITGLSGSASIAGHSLSVGEMPSHNHGGGSHTHGLPSGFRLYHSGSYRGGPQTNLDHPQEPWYWLDTAVTDYSGTVISTTGGDDAHGHPGSVMSVSQNGAWRPSYGNAIICTKS